MMQREEAKIFLADERGVSEADWFRSCSTFNFGKYYSEHKHPFANIDIINDDSLDTGCSLQMLVEKDYYIVLVPVIGAIKYKSSTSECNLVAAGQSQFLAAKKGDKIQISNPFDEGLINFLQIWIRPDSEEIIRNSVLCDFDVNRCKNSFQIISPAGSAENTVPFIASIAKFDGRGEAIYQVKNEKTGLFVFVIEGAFEVQDRLLHARDGLALWNTSDVEIEALSNDAIILVIETSEKE